MKLNRTLVLVFAAALLSAPAAAQGYPTPTGDPVTDLGSVLDASDESSLNALLVRLRNETGVDARVLTIRSRGQYRTGDRDLQQFANRLMNAWEVGDAARKDGALLVLAVDDREAWIALGARYGTDYDRRMQEVMDGRMIPRFREGDYGAGVVDGAREMARILGGSGQPATAENPDPAAASPPSSSAPSSPAAAQPAVSQTPTSSGGSSGGGGAGLGAAVAAAAAGLLGLLGWSRFRPRKCAECGQKMEKLSETADDVYLDSGQKQEELLGSVDYEAWRCAGCNTHQIVPRRSLFTSTRECPACKYRTLQVKTSVLEHPTYTSTGRQQVTKDCKHCGHHDEDIVTLPRKTRTTTSSSSGSRSSFGGGSRSSGGGSRSSGRGAGGKW